MGGRKRRGNARKATRKQERLALNIQQKGPAGQKLKGDMKRGDKPVSGTGRDVHDASHSVQQSEGDAMDAAVPWNAYQELPTIGLCNLGNTCFFNSALQNIFRTFPLHKALFADSKRKSDIPLGPVTKALRRTLMDMRAPVGIRKERPYSPSSLLSAVQRTCPQFKGFAQQDAHELFVCLVCCLDEEELAARKKAAQYSAETKQSINETADDPLTGEVDASRSVLRPVGQVVTTAVLNPNQSGTCTEVVTVADSTRGNAVGEDIAPKCFGEGNVKGGIDMDSERDTGGPSPFKDEVENEVGQVWQGPKLDQSQDGRTEEGERKGNMVLLGPSLTKNDKTVSTPSDVKIGEEIAELVENKAATKFCPGGMERGIGGMAGNGEVDGGSVGSASMVAADRRCHLKDAQIKGDVYDSSMQNPSKTKPDLNGRKGNDMVATIPEEGKEGYESMKTGTALRDTSCQSGPDGSPLLSTDHHYECSNKSEEKCSISQERIGMINANSRLQISQQAKDVNCVLNHSPFIGASRDGDEEVITTGRADSLSQEACNEPGYPAKCSPTISILPPSNKKLISTTPKAAVSLTKDACSPAPTQPRPAVQRVYGGTMCSEVTCLRCRARSYCVESSFCISLEIPGHHSSMRARGQGGAQSSGHRTWQGGKGASGNMAVGTGKPAHRAWKEDQTAAAGVRCGKAVKAMQLAEADGKASGFEISKDQKKKLAKLEKRQQRNKKRRKGGERGARTVSTDQDMSSDEVENPHADRGATPEATQATPASTTAALSSSHSKEGNCEGEEGLSQQTGAATLEEVDSKESCLPPEAENSLEEDGDDLKKGAPSQAPDSKSDSTMRLHKQVDLSHLLTVDLPTVCGNSGEREGLENCKAAMVAVPGETEGNCQLRLGIAGAEEIGTGETENEGCEATASSPSPSGVDGLPSDCPRQEVECGTPTPLSLGCRTAPSPGEGNVGSLVNDEMAVQVGEKTRGSKCGDIDRVDNNGGLADHCAGSIRSDSGSNTLETEGSDSYGSTPVPKSRDRPGPYLNHRACGAIEAFEAKAQNGYCGARNDVTETLAGDMAHQVVISALERCIAAVGTPASLPTTNSVVAIESLVKATEVGAEDDMLWQNGQLPFKTGQGTVRSSDDDGDDNSSGDEGGYEEEPLSRLKYPPTVERPNRVAQDLYSCLDNFTCAEELSVKDGNGYDCGKCGPSSKAKGSRSNASKRVLLLEPPCVLVFHLKRLQARAKVNRLVSFPEVLDMDPYCWRDPMASLPRASTCYHLFGLVVHHGGKGSGHFVSFVREGETWKHVSDSSVRECVPIEVLKSQAYMLFYQREGIEPSSGGEEGSDGDGETCSAPEDPSTRDVEDTRACKESDKEEEGRGAKEESTVKDSDVPSSEEQAYHLSGESPVSTACANARDSVHATDDCVLTPEGGQAILGETLKAHADEGPGKDENGKSSLTDCTINQAQSGGPSTGTVSRIEARNEEDGVDGHVAVRTGAPLGDQGRDEVV